MRTEADIDPIMEEDLSFALVLANPCYYTSPLEFFMMALLYDQFAAQNLLLDFA